MKKIFICCVLALAGISIGFADPAPIVNTVENDVAVYISEDLKLEPISKHEENAALYYTIDASYPELEGKALSENAKKFNELVSKIVEDEIKQFKKYIAEDMIHMKNLPEEVKHNSLHIDYDANVLSPNDHEIISIRFSTEGMQAGRAHPYHTHRVINFDLKTGKILALQDLFKSHAKYLQVIADYCKAALSKKLDDKWMIAEGTKPVEKNYAIWNVDANSLVITFDEYQVAPYSSGMQEVDIPYSALKEVIGGTSVISSCVVDSKDCLVEKK